MFDEIIGVTAFCKGGSPKKVKPAAPPRPEDAIYGAKATVAARQRNARGFSSTILASASGSILNPAGGSTILGQFR